MLRGGVGQKIVGDRFLMDVDASERHWIKSTSTGYIMRGHHSKIVMTEYRKIGDCVILMAECLAVRETTIKTSQKCIQ